MNSNSQPLQASFARDLGLFDAVMIGVGAMIGAGIFVLTGIAAGQSGPASILAFALNGAVTLITAFAYAELASAIPRAGGGYTFVARAFPGVVGFTSGWLLWFAYTVACSLYALGFAGYFWEFLLRYLSGPASMVLGGGEHLTSLFITLMVGFIFVRLNIRGAEVTGNAENLLTMSKLAVLGIFVFYGFRRFFEMPEMAANSFSPFFPLGFGGVLVAMGLTFIAFEGYDLIATVAEEIREPEKNIPRATFIALGITVMMYLLILFVSLAAIRSGNSPSWKFLGEYKETAIVRAAEDFMPTFGVAIIVFGGLLSTMSALNATILASSRVAFSMGRDKWLPEFMSRIHPQRRTPHIAIITTGFILLGMAILLPIEAVGSAASLIFLLTFAMVNLSVIVLRRKAPEIERRYKVPFYPVIPILGICLNILLAVYQFRFQPIAWYVTMGWILLGLFIYFSYFKRQASSKLPQVLVPTNQKEVSLGQYTVVVPLHNPDNVRILLQIASPIAAARHGRVIAMAVVVVPRQLPIHEGLQFMHQKESLFKEAREFAAEHQVMLETDCVIAHHTHDGIFTAAEHYRADLLVMGWKGHTDTRGRIFGEVADHVIRHTPCDLILFKSSGHERFQKCLLPTAGGPHARLAVDFINILARPLQMSVTAGYVVPIGATAEVQARGAKWIEKTLLHINKSLRVNQKLIESDSVAEGIVKESQDFDLVVIGAAREPLFRKALIGDIPEKVARYSSASVLVVKRYEGTVKSFLKKTFG